MRDGDGADGERDPDEGTGRVSREGIDGGASARAMGSFGDPAIVPARPD
jgi:hypothetical protein